MKYIKMSVLALALSATQLFAQSHAPQIVTADAMPQKVLEALPAAVKVDDKDLSKTMKAMGKNYRDLRKAENLAAMKEPAQQLAIYASQAEALGLDPEKATEASKKVYLEGIQTMRHQIRDLQKAIENNQLEEAKALILAIGETKNKGHDYFEVK